VFEKITIKEYCDRENISRTTAENRIKSGKIETIKEGRNRFVKVYKPLQNDTKQILGQ